MRRHSQARRAAGCLRECTDATMPEDSRPVRLRLADFADFFRSTCLSRFAGLLRSTREEGSDHARTPNAALALGLVAIVGAAAACAAYRTQATPGKLLVIGLPGRIDVSAGGKRTLPVTLRNATGLAVRIVGTQSSCDCLRWEMPATTLLPGGTAAAHLTIDLGHEPAARDFGPTIDFFDDHDAKRLTLDLDIHVVRERPGG